MNVGLIGAGAIATYLLEELYQNDEIAVTSIFVRNKEKYAYLQEQYGISLFTNLHDFLGADIDIVVEAANVEAVQEILPIVLKQKDTVLISIGALVEEDFLKQLNHLTKTYDKRLYLPSGAIGGIDLIQNVAAANILNEVSLVTRKPAHTLVSESLCREQVVFEGKAKEAIKKYPKNMNVSIALALAGIGFERTNVTLIADPHVTKNIHSIEVKGDSGTACFMITNEALPQNPNTSYLAAVSIIGTLRRANQRIKIG